MVAMLAAVLKWIALEFPSQCPGFALVCPVTFARGWVCDGFGLRLGLFWCTSISDVFVHAFLFARVMCVTCHICLVDVDGSGCITCVHAMIGVLKSSLFFRFDCSRVAPCSAYGQVLKAI